MKKKVLLFSLAAILLLSTACGGSAPAPSAPAPAASAPAPTPAPNPAPAPEPKPAPNPEPKQPAPATGKLILATTTSTMDSGLLDVIIPEFEKETNLSVDIISVGTGAAIQMGKDGEADVLLVHDKASEEAFMADGFGTSRKQVMYNDYILVGDPEDPAGVKENSPTNILDSLKAIAGSESNFISRGDDSGTNKLELRLWKAAEIEPTGDWYINAGAGMGDCLRMANELKGYTISDRATYLNLRDTLELVVVCENDNALFNQYGVLVVNDDRDNLKGKINVAGAEAFSEWITGANGQALINQFGIEKFSAPLFVGNAE